MIQLQQVSILKMDSIDLKMVNTKDADSILDTDVCGLCWKGLKSLTGVVVCLAMEVQLIVRVKRRICRFSASED